MKKVSYISPPICIEHFTGAGHPECPARLDSINAHLRESGMWQDLYHVAAMRATVKQITAIHDGQHVDLVANLITRGESSLDGDTQVCPKSLEAAYLAAGSAITGVELLRTEQRVFCGVRPPGHHAESDRSMGFCIFNNVAVAAQYAIDQGIAERVLILDWDVHHGNGTQEIFYASDKVFYYSLHQFPFYPGTGSERETGSGAGLGFTLNRPLGAGTDNDTYFRLLETDLEHIGTSFKPDLVIISAGFDAHEHDLLGGMRVTTEGFARMTRMVAQMADVHAGGRVLSVLEGGYHLGALADSVATHLDALGNA